MRESHSGSRHLVGSGKLKPDSTATSTADRRGNARVQFTATAEVVELSSGARFSTRTTDLGPGGCFVDTMVPFPVGSIVQVSLEKGKTRFETGGRVVYSQSGLGMGIAFSELTPEQTSALEHWIGQLTAEKKHNEPIPATSPKGFRTQGPGPERALLVRMIQLFIHKGFLTEAEGTALLHEPLL
jgi:hypothetical protein